MTQGGPGRRGREGAGRFRSAVSLCHLSYTGANKNKSEKKVYKKDSNVKIEDIYS
jgi:hypothetical protein